MFVLDHQLFLLGGDNGLFLNHKMWVCALSETGYPYGLWTLIDNVPSDLDVDKFFA